MENKLRVRNMISVLYKISKSHSIEEKMRACGFLEACLLQYGKLEWGQDFDYQEREEVLHGIFGKKKYMVKERYDDHIVRLTNELIYELDV